MIPIQGEVQDCWFESCIFEEMKNSGEDWQQRGISPLPVFPLT
jgi:hypothetical protein